ncbi:MAG TPA: DUF4157 domain-containing protein [Longimicrobium sp.]|nr:DUF4157 domain-containing protein [Longimicrobium sp.]
MAKLKAERMGAGRDRTSHAQAAKPSHAGRLAAPRGEAAAPATATRTLARRVGDQRARQAMVAPTPPRPSGPLATPGRLSAPGPRAPAITPAASRAIHRCGCGGACPACRAREESVHRQARDGGGSDGYADAVDMRPRGPGRGLDPATRGFMEPRFGRDFGGVRLHTGPEAARSARGLDARAFTVGQDIYFGQGEYSPGTQGGRRLLAHELTHTVQQSGAAPSPQTALRVSRPGDALEVEADRVADVVTRSARAEVRRDEGAAETAPGIGGIGEGGRALGPREDGRLLAHELLQGGTAGTMMVQRQTPGPSTSPASLAVLRAPQAQQWAVSAIGALMSLAATAARPSREQLARRREFQVLSRHFHVGPDAYLRAVYLVAGVFRGVVTTLGRARELFVDSPATGDGEHAAAFLPEPRDGRIHITPLYATGLGPVSQLYVLVHEAAHYQSPDIIDYSNPDRPNSTYSRLTFDNAMMNAYSFSEFALEINRGTTRRTDSD